MLSSIFETNCSNDGTGGIYLGDGGQEDGGVVNREDQQDELVEQAGRLRRGDQHQESPAGELKAKRPGRRDQVHGREDDVRSGKPHRSGVEI